MSEKRKTQDVAEGKNASARPCVNGNNHHKKFLT
jgi:hypothetical protein